MPYIANDEKISFIACALVELELHFPERGRGRQTREAKRVCARCPIRVECLEGAIERREPYGIWGGMTERERHKEIKRRASFGSEMPLLSVSA